MLFASAISAFFTYVFNGVTAILFAIAILSPAVIVISAIYFYVKHLYKDPVHKSPGLVFSEDVELFVKVVGMIVVVLGILFGIGYLATLFIK